MHTLPFVESCILKTSSEVELMETVCTCFAVSGKLLKTSSEVELMETIKGFNLPHSLCFHSKLLRKLN